MSAFVKKEIDKVGFRKKPSRADLGWEALLAGPDGKTVLAYGANRVIFCQGQPADSIFFVRRGKVKLSVTSKQGKEAIIAILGAEEFFGQGCLAGQTERNSTAIAMTDCSLAEVKKPRMTRMFEERQDINELFVTHLLSRNIRYEEDLVDQLFTRVNKRLVLGSPGAGSHSASTAELKSKFLESVRITWPKWSAPRGRGSVTS